MKASSKALELIKQLEGLRLKAYLCPGGVCSAFSKTSLNIWKFTVHVLLKPGLENFKHYFTSV